MTEPRVGGALMTGLDLLEALSTVTKPVGVTELSRLVDGDKGNVHRLLAALEARGYVTRHEATKGYSLAPAVVQLAGTMLRNMDLVTLARPLMAELVAITGESTHLAHRTSRGGVYLARERKSQGIMVETEIGAEVAIHATATGKALFCCEEPERVAELVGPKLERFTNLTITDIDGFLAELAETRARGYAVDDEELNLGVRCVAAPITDIEGQVVASVGLSGPANRVTRDRIDDYGRMVGDVANKLTAHLGGTWPSATETTA